MKGSEMGLDLYLQGKICPTCGKSENPEIGWNYTYNVSPMWREVFPDTKMINIDGMTCQESLPKLEKFRDALKADPEKFKKMNPDNGWGDYDSFLKAIEELIIYENTYPDCIWDSWR